MYKEGHEKEDKQIYICTLRNLNKNEFGCKIDILPLLFAINSLIFFLFTSMNLYKILYYWNDFLIKVKLIHCKITIVIFLNLFVSV